MLPHSRSFDDPDGLEEERRLLYVGVTRAENRLYLAHTFRRTMFGSSDLGEPSRFLADIPARLKRDGNARPGRGSRAGTGARYAVQAQMSLGRSRHAAPPRDKGSLHRRESPTRQDAVRQPFATGDKVRHPAFGQGTVIQLNRRGDDWDVTVAFKGRGIKTLALSFAKLEKAQEP
jgi:DNA helicase-2/ATP-dependent DNA helicase PcrA